MRGQLVALLWNWPVTQQAKSSSFIPISKNIVRENKEIQDPGCRFYDRKVLWAFSYDKKKSSSFNEISVISSSWRSSLVVRMVRAWYGITAYFLSLLEAHSSFRSRNLHPESGIPLISSSSQKSGSQVAFHLFISRPSPGSHGFKYGIVIAKGFEVCGTYNTG